MNRWDDLWNRLFMAGWDNYVEETSTPRTEDEVRLCADSANKVVALAKEEAERFECESSE